MTDTKEPAVPTERTFLREAELAALPEEVANAARMLGAFLLQAVCESELVEWSEEREMKGVLIDLERYATILTSYGEQYDLPALQNPAVAWSNTLRQVITEFRAHRETTEKV